MENQRFMQEGIDGKRIVLLFGKKLWLFAAAILAGAAFGGGIYLLIHFLFASQREYESVSKIYLNFNCDPEDYNELSYNGYTWNDLMATDPILNYTMENLPPEMNRETVIRATKAEILSDIRLLTITVTTNSPELSAQIMEATQAALLHLGETDELFESIEIYSTMEPRQIVWDNRTARAAIMGMAIALFIVLVAAAFYYVLDDSVYVAEDVEKRYGIPAIGILAEGRQEFVKSYDEEFLANYCYLGRNMRTTALISVDSNEDAEKAGKRIHRLLAGNGECRNLVYGMPEEDAGIYAKLREADGVVVAVRFGARNGKRMERLLGNLKKQDCRILGAAITGAEESFLRAYYINGKSREKK